VKPTLRDLGESLVAYARKCGADEAEVSVVDGYEFNVDVRKGRIETLIEAGSRSAGIKVIKDKRTAYASSSDLDQGTLRRLVRSAVRRAGLGSPDEFAGLAPLAAGRVDAAALDLGSAGQDAGWAEASVDLVPLLTRVEEVERTLAGRGGGGRIQQGALGGSALACRGCFQRIEPGADPGGIHQLHQGVEEGGGAAEE